VWPFALTDGYGHVYVEGKRHVASRLICEVTNGPPPGPEYEAAHSCGNRACVASKHLRWATPKENCADRVLHGTYKWGTQIHCAKLTVEKADHVRKLGPTKTQAEIAKLVGIHASQVSRILAGKAWLPREVRT
jgi:hypothetical protein